VSRTAADGPLRVLRIAHSDVVAAWRERERNLIRRGVDIHLLTAEVWDEGGSPVAFTAGTDDFAEGATTLGRHPNVFLFDPRALWRLLGGRWDVIDIHEEPCSLATAEVLLLRWLRGNKAPYILYSAQNIAKRYPPPFRWTERLALRSAAAISVCNRAAGQIARSKGLTGTVAEIPLGVDLTRFTPADREPPRDGSAQIGYIGRLAAHKGVSVLLESLVTRPSWRLDIAGAGPDEEALRAQVSGAELAPRVRFRGSVGEDDLPAVYRSLDVIAVPSLPTPRWEEQFCRVAVEAMASGVPVVASRSGALPEVIGDAGLLVAPGDAAALRAGIDAVVSDPVRWSELRTAGLERAQRFTWDAVAEAYEALYAGAV